VIGSGPAGLAAAQQLRRAGHSVVVFEKNERVGGLLRFGIPEFKLEKSVLDLRLEQLEAEGVAFETGVNVGEDITAHELRLRFDAICIATGAESPRDLPVPGRDLKGIHFAMDFLTAQNRRLNGILPISDEIHARHRNVVIIGGGDTGSDCAGTCIRQGAKSVTQFELLPQPPVGRAPSTPWPLWPMMLRSSHAHEEGCAREWSIATTLFSGENGRVTHLHTARVEARTLADGRLDFARIPGSEAEIETDLVLLAMGFTGPVRSRLLVDLGVEFDARGNIKTDGSHRTSVDGVFAAGDARRGQSLIVWAIREGRDAADAIHSWLRTRPVGEHGA
jgi:glutamate synthase (NADPH/NADH) small chain